MSFSSVSPLKQQRLLLIVEDSNEDFEALQRFVKRSPQTIPIKRCVNGEQALAFLSGTGSYLDSETSVKMAANLGLIILDLNLPGIDGREVLHRIKQDAKLKTIPVVVFTTSNNPKDIEECYQYGVNSYIIKPIDFTQLKQDIQILINYWFEVTTLPDCPLQ